VVNTDSRKVFPRIVKRMAGPCEAGHNDGRGSPLCDSSTVRRPILYNRLFSVPPIFRLCSTNLRRECSLRCPSRHDLSTCQNCSNDRNCFSPGLFASDAVRCPAGAECSLTTGGEYAILNVVSRSRALDGYMAPLRPRERSDPITFAASAFRPVAEYSRQEARCGSGRRGTRGIWLLLEQTRERAVKDAIGQRIRVAPRRHRGKGRRRSRALSIDLFQS
jgi:hypothetical protein